MKVIIFGAAGGTGKEIVKLALEAGHKVTAIVRNPSAFQLEHKDLIISKADVMNSDSFAQSISGQDVVISALGNGSTKPTTLFSVGVMNIINAMNANGIHRLICISAGALDTNPEMGFFIRMLAKMILQPILKEMYADMRLMETEIKQTKLNYTIIRPPMLKNKQLTGKYRSAINKHLIRPFSIARADLAHYIVTHINDSQTFQSVVEIAY